MEIGIGDCRIPTDDDIAAYPDFKLAKEYGIRKIAVVTDRNVTFRTNRKMDAFHRAVDAHAEPDMLLTMKSFEGAIAGDHRIDAQPDIVRQLAGSPAASVL